MNASDYQKQATRTLIARPNFELSRLDWRRVINALALSVTAGAIVEHYKKGIFHQHGYDDGRVAEWLDEVYKIRSLFFIEQQALTRPGFISMRVMVIWNVVGLIGEVAEIGKLILEGLGKGEFDTEKLAEELGDAEWYIAALCSKFGLDLGEVMTANIRKLELRYPNGYQAEDSQKRVDVLENHTGE